MNWINYVFRVPFAALLTAFVCLIIVVILMVCAIFVNWQENWAELKDVFVDPDMVDFFKTVAGLK